MVQHSGPNALFWLQLALFSVAGVFARVALDAWIGSRPPEFPWGIFAINLLGSLCAGVLVGWGSAQAQSDLMRAIGLGLLGGFTTFSTFSVQTVALLQAGAWNSALAYGFGSPILGTLAAWSGYLISNGLRP